MATFCGDKYKLHLLSVKFRCKFSVRSLSPSQILVYLFLTTRWVNGGKRVNSGNGTEMMVTTVPSSEPETYSQAQLQITALSSFMRWWKDGMEGAMVAWSAIMGCLVAVATCGMQFMVTCRPATDDFFLLMEPRDTSVMLWIWARRRIKMRAFVRRKSSEVIVRKTKIARSHKWDNAWQKMVNYATLFPSGGGWNVFLLILHYYSVGFSLKYYLISHWKCTARIILDLKD